MFRYSATSVPLAGPTISAAWLAALGSFAALRELRLQRCTKLRDAALQHLAPLVPSLQTLDLGGCSGIGDGAAADLAQLTQLRDLSLAGTGLGAAAVASLAPALAGLTALDLSDLPIDDACCEALAQLRQLQRLNLAGTSVGDAGMGALEALGALTSLSVSFTQVRAVPRAVGCSVASHACCRAVRVTGVCPLAACVQAHAPPALTSLRHLNMVHCALGADDGSPQEAVWLQFGCAVRCGSLGCAFV